MPAAGLHLAELRRTARRIETGEALTARLDRLEAAIAAVTARLDRLEAAAKDQGQAEYEITTLIG